MLLEELRAGAAEQQQRQVVRPVSDVLEEGEQRVVCPVQVFEDEHGRALCGQRFQEAAPGRERLLLRCRLGRRAHERRQTRLEPGAVGIVCGQRSVELGFGLGGRV